MKKISSNLKGKVVLITGGAQGVGQIMAKEFARQGAAVVISDIQDSAGKATVGALRKQGLSVTFVRADLCLAKDIKQMIAFTSKLKGRIDIIINNARPRLPVGTFEQTLKDWDLAMKVILKAPVLMMKYALPHLVKSGGAVINIVSSNALTISHQPAAYHVAKAGLVQLTRYLAYEFGPKGIRVNAVCPALIDVHDRPSLTSNVENKEVVQISVPLKRAATPEDIAHAAIFLSSPGASYITGEVLTVDGGISLGDHFHVARQAFRSAQKNNQNK